uniref:Uncharacterized protein n=1 Tax=Rhizophora mucronata TaxID=61149 RepID=A0A2P2JR86_RHIMU
MKPSQHPKNSPAITKHEAAAIEAYKTNVLFIFLSLRRRRSQWCRLPLSSRGPASPPLVITHFRDLHLRSNHTQFLLCRPRGSHRSTNELRVVHFGYLLALIDAHTSIAIENPLFSVLDTRPVLLFLFGL